MQRRLRRSLQPGFGVRPGMTGCLLAALAGVAWGAGRTAAQGPRQRPFAISDGSRREAAPRRRAALGAGLWALQDGSLFAASRPCSNSSPNTPAEFYERRIRPLLAKNCYSCHGRAKTSGLDLRTRDGMLRGGSRGPALVPGGPEASRLYRYVAHLEQPSMPPADPLAAREVAALKAWIAAGAPTAGGS